jgi:hypothetical protein
VDRQILYFETDANDWATNSYVEIRANYCMLKLIGVQLFAVLVAPPPPHTVVGANLCVRGLYFVARSLSSYVGNVFGLQ